MTYTPPPFPTGIGPGKSKPSAKTLQAALKKAGFLAGTVTASDTYGPQTEAAVSRFYVAHGDAPSTSIGPVGWKDLFVAAYGGVQAPGDPGQDMARITYTGHTINKRTKVLLNRAGTFTLIQGSYHPGVAASAGTHDGGGVVDVSISGKTQSQINDLILRLRKVGFAAWERTPAEGFVYHVHACAIGDEQMAPLAQQQVQSYFNGRNGLSGNGADTFHGGRPWPAWAAKYNH